MDGYFSNFGFNIQFIPLYGIAIGFLYYNPNLEPNNEKTKKEDFYEQLTFMFLLFGIHITWYRL